MKRYRGNPLTAIFKSLARIDATSEHKYKFCIQGEYMKESTLEKYLVKEISKLNGLCLKWVAPGTRGVPDRIIIMPEGKTYFVEMKQEKGKLHPLQKYVHRQFENRDHKVYVLWNKEQVNTFIRMVGGTFGD